ncbi:MAG: hypothetical protein ACOYK6_04195 [Chthoniobacterales bacterium]
MNTSNTPEAIENDLVYNIYKSFALAFKNNIPVTIDGRTIKTRSLFEDAQKIEAFLDVILKKENQDPSERVVIDIFQIKEKISKMRAAQEFFNSEPTIESGPSQDGFVEDSFFLKTV